MDGLTVVSATDARARIASLMASRLPLDGKLGSVELRPHQQIAVRRIEAAMREFGGALLADETGLGKTYVAMCIAKTSPRSVVVAPAALRDMWREAGAAAGVDIPFLSMEALSRRHASQHAGTMPDLVVVDEAHHLRNRATARYRAVAELTNNARVLLLSATPVHNSPDDLAALLGLFLGARATKLDPAWMARCIIRRRPGDTSVGIPRVDPPVPLHIDHDDRHLGAILALPPPVPPLDGSDGGTLLVYSLLRQWASTQGALVEALRRRLARAMAILAGLEVGRHPSASELSAWLFAEGAVQLAFPELMIAETPVVDTGALARCVSAHAASVRALLESLERSANPDVQRAAQLTALRSKHRGVKIVVFSQYAESVSAVFRLMRREPGVAALTAAGGRVVDGTLTRRETLARFAPRAQGAAPAGRAYDIDLLLTTDLLSEGVNLQDAGAIVHLDLPWTPARLEQRVGRIARMGSMHHSVAVYALMPPASSERIVRVEQRLRDKLRDATRMVGVVGTIIPSLRLEAALSEAPNAQSHAVGSSEASPACRAEEILAIIASWRGSGPAVLDHAPVIAAVNGSSNGFLALVGDIAQPRLIADLGAGPTDDPTTVLTALGAASGTQGTVDERARARAVSRIARWRSATGMRRDLSVDGTLQARARRSVVERIAAITRRAPRHRRSTITALAASARRTAITRYGAGAERVLGELAAASMPDEAWLMAVSTFGALHNVAADSGPETDHPLLALILLRDASFAVNEK